MGDPTTAVPAANADDQELADMQARIDAARARKEATQDRIAAAQRKKKLELELEAEERQANEAEKLEALVEQYGPVGKALAVLRTDEGHMIVARTPAQVHVKRFRTKKGFESPDAQDELARVSVAYPDKAAFDKLVERWPFLAEQVCVKAINLARARTQEESGE
jgi:hypothetical protein